MKKEEANRLLAICKNFDNVSTLLGDLVMPIAAMKQKYKCTDAEACNIKLKAEDWLSKYGCLSLGASVKSVKQMTNVIDE